MVISTHSRRIAYLQTYGFAWQFHRSDLDEGMVQAFRRSGNDVSDTVFTLHGLSPEVQYAVTNFDVPGTSRMTGLELMDKGISVSINQARGSAVIRL